MAQAKRVYGWLEGSLVLLLTLVSAAVVCWQNTRLAVLWDLSYILENSYRISLGDIPYRDFPFPYAPLTFLIQAELIKLTGRQFFHHVIYCAVVGALGTLLTWRILLSILRRQTPYARLLALILTAPLTVLGIYAIYPHPFYDPDCTFVILVCLLLLVTWESGSGSPGLGFVSGASLVAPVLVKQNSGLAFVASAVAGFILLVTIDLWRRRPLRKYLWPLGGFVVAAGLGIWMIHAIAGLGNYYRWTVRFAAERRTPALAEMAGIYRDPLLKWWLALVVIGGLLLLLNRGRRLLIGLSVILLTAPFLWSVVYLLIDKDSSERAERLLGLWPYLLILSLLSVLLTFRRTGEIPILPLVIIGTVHGAFLSQQLWGSTYPLWPLFMILAATVIAAFTVELAKPSSNDSPDDREGKPFETEFYWSTILTCIWSVSLLISGFFYLRSHERLDYANLEDGELTHSKLPALKGLSMRGSWIPDFEELVDYSEKHVPFDDGILLLPGEDLFYYTTGRRPRFPVLLFDHTVNPYSPQEIVTLARERNIQWLIVKNELQMEEEPLEHKDELMNLLFQEFESVESLNNYEIYKRKSPDSEDDNASEDKTPDSEER